MSETKQAGPESTPDPQVNGAANSTNGASGAQTPPREAPAAPGDGAGAPTAAGNAAPDGGAPQTGAPGGQAAPRPSRPWLKPLLIGGLILAAIAGGIWGIHFWNWSKTHVSTDDAYVSGNLVNVSP